MKKGQLTIIMIVAVIIIIAAGAMIYFSQREVASEEIRRLLVDVPEMGKPIASYIYSCIDGSAAPGIGTIARGGGYIFPIDPIATAYGDITYGMRGSVSKLVTKEEMQNQLAGYMGAAVLNCFDQTLFEQQGLTIEAEEITVSSQILPDKVIFTVNFPIKISKEQSTITLTDFVWEAELPLGRLHALAGKTLEKIDPETGYLSVSFMETINQEIEVFPINPETVAIAIRDPTVFVNNKPLTFLLAAEIKQNFPPRFTNLPAELIFIENQQVSFKVEAEDPEGEAITFTADPTLFDINEETGQFAFEPEIPGEYLVTFRVHDEQGNTFRRNVNIIIEPRE